ncbi:MAG: exosortase/archaeosortase family protein [Planctomycetes bacterium]|nr:exosortase/archaeosortase family protein [Planctomycetota bacterium]
MNSGLQVALPIVFAYALTSVWIWDNWMLEESSYSHGPLIPIGMAAWFWMRRADWRALPVTIDGRGWWLLGPGLFLHVCGAGLTVDSLSAASLCLTIPGAVLLAQGAVRFRNWLPILGLVAFAVPLPMFVTGQLVFVLKEVAVDAGLTLGNWFGADAVRQGANIRIANEATPLVVADACGGLRSLVSLLTVSYVIVFLLGSARGLWRWILMVVAIPVAVLTNVVRIAAMCVMSRQYGVEFGSTTGHDVAGMAVFVLGFGIMFGLDTLVARRQAS